MSDSTPRRALVTGIANERSIAWAIARALAADGFELALTFVGDALERRVRPLAAEIGAGLVLPCDVNSDADIAQLFTTLGEEWGNLDVVVHSIAFARREDLMGRFIDTDREGFRLALDTSAYSLLALARGAHPLLKAAGGGSIITLTFEGSRRVFPNYNIMGVAKAALEACVRYLAADLGPDGIRVNAISAGPIKTLSAAGIRNFRDMLRFAGERAPLRRTVSPEDVAALARLLATTDGSGITGQVLPVDAGLSILGI